MAGFGFLSQPITPTTLFSKSRKIGDITVNVVVHESTNDTLTITKQPVQIGSSITDHAYKEPTVFSMTCYFQDNILTSLSEVYQSLLDLQATRVPFDVFTPKRIYKSMLISSLGMTTDQKTENVLSITATFQEVILVAVTTVQVSRLRQKNAGATGKTQKAGRKSALATLANGIGGLLGR